MYWLPYEKKNAKRKNFFPITHWDSQLADGRSEFHKMFNNNNVFQGGPSVGKSTLTSITIRD